MQHIADSKLHTCRVSSGQGGLPGCIETLEHHWDSLPDSRKQTFAQMAVLTRLSPISRTMLTSLEAASSRYQRHAFMLPLRMISVITEGAMRDICFAGSCASYSYTKDCLNVKLSQIAALSNGISFHIGCGEMPGLQKRHAVVQGIHGRRRKCRSYGYKAHSIPPCAICMQQSHHL